MPRSERAAVFLDRDGTAMQDVGFPRDPETVRLLPDAAATLRALHDSGRALVVVSNQSGLARGIIAPEQAQAVHERFVELLAAEGVEIDAFRYCPHGPDDGCDCRKPAPGMLNDAATELGLDLAASTMIGDRASDIEAGRAAGCAVTILLSADGEGDADIVARDWAQVGVELLNGVAR